MAARALRPAPQIEGSAVIEEPNSTTFEMLGDRAVIDARGNIVITPGDTRVEMEPDEI